MTLNINTTGMALTDAIRDYLEKKLNALDKLVDFSKDNILIRAELGKTSHHHKAGDFFRAEVNIRISGHEYRAVSEKDDLYAAIDDMKDELVREITSDKDKHRIERRKGGKEAKEMMHQDSDSE